MHHHTLLLPFLLAALTSAKPTKRDDTWGGALSLGPTTSHIIHAITTLVPGAAPSSQNGELFLWPGMSNGTGDLIQTTLESWPDNSWCGATPGQWCVRASLFGSFGQLDGQAGVVGEEDQVRIEYSRSADGLVWIQNVTNAVTGAYLSSFSHESGPMTGWGTGTECDDDCSGTVSAQTYKNTTITLASSDTAFGDTLGVSGGTTYSGLSVSADGTVWHIDSISVPAMD
ncbi:uncharacterized protein LY89DRAFT_448834 [Mollisia scopiformis]|uniref:Lectin n=1 Tax=Mollisia scopiformis TaxID=149040 RepID=A0A194XKE1_MOLSC|nr:uncharacterized protein LY89DRAFT_448834 [Mollisia scopiformis]KUJ20628.1 hypothetical protein LY89DRAFT_448834 [Mollisia scopiformis]